MSTSCTWLASTISRTKDSTLHSMRSNHNLQAARFTDILTVKRTSNEFQFDFAPCWAGEVSRSSWSLGTMRNYCSIWLVSFIDRYYHVPYAWHNVCDSYRMLMKQKLLSPWFVQVRSLSFARPYCALCIADFVPSCSSIPKIVVEKFVRITTG